MARQISSIPSVGIELALKEATPGRLRYLHDGGGLYLAVDGRRMQPGEKPSASWVFRYMLYGKARMMGLGPYPAVKLADARRTAAQARAAKARGEDPLALKDAERAKRTAAMARAVTFKEVAKEYLRANDVKWSNPKHAAQWSSTLAAYAFPIIGDWIVGDIDTPAVLKVLRQEIQDGKRTLPLWEARPETASRLRGRIETVLDYARVKNLRTGDNPASWRGNLKLALPARSKVRRVKHHSALQIGQLPEFMKQLREAQGLGARALEFAILTAARSGEVLGATWSEIDLVAGVWCIPGERMKAGREHRVPLSPAARALLESIAQAGAHPEEYVFPGTRRGKPLSGMTFLMLLRRLGHGEVTAHGFRSTFRDWVSEETGFAPELAERALAHAVSDKTEAAYARGDLFQKRRALMDAWASYCESADAVVTKAA